jgi:predicted nucleic acid-binding protein
MGTTEEERMSAFVVDASVLFKTLIREVGSDDADALVASAHIIVPEIVYPEVGNAIWSRRRIAGITDETARDFIDHFGRAAFEVHSNRPYMSRAFAIAVALDHPIYDCIYLALAERLGIPLITADQRFITTVRKRDIALSPVVSLGAHP